MLVLIRLTTKYDVEQDRICISGEVKDGQAVVLWLTQRLLNRLVLHVSSKLELPEPTKVKPLSVQTQVQQSFAQQRARAQMPRQIPPVKPDERSPQWLVSKVDVKSGPDGVRLIFNGTDKNDQAAVGLPFTPLRQFLGILHDQYRLAGWATEMWPTWVGESALSSDQTAGKVLH
jgi:hypothetical protein